MGDCSKDMEHQFAGGRSRIDAFLEADQVDVACLEVLDSFEQFLERTPEAVETGDTEAVAGAGMVDEFAQPQALELSSGNHIDKDADGAGLAQPVLLAGNILVCGRHAGIAQDIPFAGCPARLFNVRSRDSLEMLFPTSGQGPQIVPLSVSIIQAVSKRKTAFQRRATAS